MIIVEKSNMSDDGSFDRVILNRLKNRYEPIVNATIGVLLIDASVDRNKSMFFEYINDFNYRSGYKMDFFIPGFESRNAKTVSGLNDTYYTRIMQEYPVIDMYDYKFNQRVYQRAVFAISNIIENWEVLHKTTNPKLVLFDVTADSIKKRITYNDYAIWEVTCDNRDSLMKNFEAIFNLAAEGSSAKEIVNRNGLVGLKGANIRDMINNTYNRHPLASALGMSVISTSIVEAIPHIINYIQGVQ